MRLAQFDATAFLSDYWQRRPLLIRAPWDAWRNPLEPDELAGLACEEGVESRLVVGAAGKWSVEHGPIPEERFASLGQSPWTLLVQAVDHHVPDVAALIEPFRFVPDWRIDDVMVSYASDGGGVGPHFDQYDVFLIQGAGRRRWRVGPVCDAETPLRPHDDLRLLAEFEASDEWVLEAGDILYVPPGFAHDGVAVGGGCMTYSVGFRAPARGELIAGWCDHLLEVMDEDDRYADPGLAAQDNPGEITSAALDRLHAMIAERLHDRAAFARWFGSYVTAPKYAEADWRPEGPVSEEWVRAAIEAGTPLRRNPASRFSFVAGECETLVLFVDGECFDCAGDAAAFARRLCAQPVAALGRDWARSEAVRRLVTALVNRGSAAFELED